MHVKVAGAETSLGIGEVQIPHPLESLDRIRLVRHRRRGTGQPFVQGACVVPQKSLATFLWLVDPAADDGLAPGQEPDRHLC